LERALLKTDIQLSTTTTEHPSKPVKKRTWMRYALHSMNFMAAVLNLWIQQIQIAAASGDAAQSNCGSMSMYVVMMGASIYTKV
jgi:hypothetical protein